MRNFFKFCFELWELKLSSSTPSKKTSIKTGITVRTLGVGLGFFLSCDNK